MLVHDTGAGAGALAAAPAADPAAGDGQGYLLFVHKQMLMSDDICAVADGADLWRLARMIEEVVLRGRSLGQPMADPLAIAQAAGVEPAHHLTGDAPPKLVRAARQRLALAQLASVDRLCEAATLSIDVVVEIDLNYDIAATVAAEHISLVSELSEKAQQAWSDQLSSLGYYIGLKELKYLARASVAEEVVEEADRTANPTMQLITLIKGCLGACVDPVQQLPGDAAPKLLRAAQQRLATAGLANPRLAAGQEATILAEHFTKDIADKVALEHILLGDRLAEQAKVTRGGRFAPLAAEARQHFRPPPPTLATLGDKRQATGFLIEGIPDSKLDGVYRKTDEDGLGFPMFFKPMDPDPGHCTDGVHCYYHNGTRSYDRGSSHEPEEGNPRGWWFSSDGCHQGYNEVSVDTDQENIQRILDLIERTSQREDQLSAVKCRSHRFYQMYRLPQPQDDSGSLPTGTLTARFTKMPTEADINGDCWGPVTVTRLPTEASLIEAEQRHKAASEAVNAAHSALARTQLDNVQSISVYGHPIEALNGIYYKRPAASAGQPHKEASETETGLAGMHHNHYSDLVDWPLLQNDSGSICYRDERMGQWCLRDKVGLRLATIDAPEGPLPIGNHEWACARVQMKMSTVVSNDDYAVVRAPWTTQRLRVSIDRREPVDGA